MWYTRPYGLPIVAVHPMMVVAASAGGVAIRGQGRSYYILADWRSINIKYEQSRPALFTERWSD
jgi:hypothetical protein